MSSGSVSLASCLSSLRIARSSSMILSNWLMVFVSLLLHWLLFPCRRDPAAEQGHGNKRNRPRTPPDLIDGQAKRNSHSPALVRFGDRPQVHFVRQAVVVCHGDGLVWFPVAHQEPVRHD